MGENVELRKITCCSCYCLFWITSSHQDKLRKEHTTFYCPSGHSQVYPQKTDFDKAREKVCELEKSAFILHQELTLCKKKKRKK